MRKETKYEMVGIIIVKDWYGNSGYANICIETDQEGYERIKKDPLQDYLSFGVAKVTYCEFEVFKEIIYRTPKKTITVAHNEPIETITSGTPDTEIYQTALEYPNYVKIKY
ncbi:MAG: hypothetical protein DRI33_03235 [Caldiserica bacterium]|nr:MAG: hypothetical protein DRI33_03235 [Caldisericota bacterium]